MKRWLIIGGGVVVVIAVVLWFVFSSLGSLIKAGVEKYGSEITQTKVTLDEVKISVTSGKGTLRGLTVGNPEGFKTDSAFRLGEISMTLDTSSITQNPIVIKEIVVSAPEVTYEVGSGGTNIDAIQRNINAYLGIGKGKKGEKSPSEEGKEGPKLVIENFYVRNGQVNVSATILQGKKMSAALPDLHLKDIGKDKGGAKPGEVVEKVIASIGQAASMAVGTLNIDNILGTAKKGLTGAKSAIEESTKGATETLKGLFGN